MEKHVAPKVISQFHLRLSKVFQNITLVITGEGCRYLKIFKICSHTVLRSQVFHEFGTYDIVILS